MITHYFIILDFESDPQTDQTLISTFFDNLSIEWSKDFHESQEGFCEADKKEAYWFYSATIEKMHCQQNLFLPDSMYQFLLERKRENQIRDVHCVYNFAHDGQCNLSFSADFIQPLATLFDDFSISTYEDDSEEEENIE